MPNFSPFPHRRTIFALYCTRQIHCQMLALRKMKTNMTLFKILFAKTVWAKENRIKSNFFIEERFNKSKHLQFRNGICSLPKIKTAFSFALSRRFVLTGFFQIFVKSYLETIRMSKQHLVHRNFKVNTLKELIELDEKKSCFGLTAFSLFILCADSNLLLF